MAYQYKREPLPDGAGDQLANACRTPKERLVVWTLLDTGLRAGEFAALTRDNVLWQQKALRFKGKGGPYGKKTKVRTVPVSKRVMALLEHHFALHESMPFTKRTVERIVKQVANKAGLTQEVVPHVLRHTFACDAIRRGISLPALQRILGHDRLETTAIYLNLTPQHVLDEFHQKW
jgi:integrase/recombinase XerD